MRVLVTRPEPAATATATELAALGHEALVAPLLVTAPCRWDAPEDASPALLVTSANAVRYGGDALSRYLALPVFAVGAATAAALDNAGFADVRNVGADVAAALAAAHASGFAALLHLAGANRTAARRPDGLSVEVRTVYRARRARTLPDAARTALARARIDVVLLYSTRSAKTFAALVDRAGLARTALHLAALSPAIAVAAGTGWGRISVAAAPDECALFAAAGLVCDKSVASTGLAGKG